MDMFESLGQGQMLLGEGNRQFAVTLAVGA